MFGLQEPGRKLENKTNDNLTSCLYLGFRISGKTEKKMLENTLEKKPNPNLSLSFSSSFQQPETKSTKQYYPISPCAGPQWGFSFLALFKNLTLEEQNFKFHSFWFPDFSQDPNMNPQNWTETLTKDLAKN